MPEKSLTPERQLLKLIEEGSAGTPGASSRMESLRRGSLSLLSPAAWLGRFSFFNFKVKDWFKPGRGLRRLDIKAINSILGFSVFILAGYMAINFSALGLGLKKIPAGLELNPAGGVSVSGAMVKTSILKSVSYYLEKVRSRDIFKMAEEEAKEGGTSKAKPPSQRITELVKNLKLVGISWSADPDVMIEDTVIQKTFFLKKGQSLENLNLKLEAVFKDKVVLTSGGEEAELR